MRFLSHAYRYRDWNSCICALLYFYLLLGYYNIVGLGLNFMHIEDFVINYLTYRILRRRSWKQSISEPLFCFQHELVPGGQHFHCIMTTNYINALNLFTTLFATIYKLLSHHEPTCLHRHRLVSEKTYNKTKVFRNKRDIRIQMTHEILHSTSCSNDRTEYAFKQLAYTLQYIVKMINYKLPPPIVHKNARLKSLCSTIIWSRFLVRLWIILYKFDSASPCRSLVMRWLVHVG